MMNINDKTILIVGGSGSWGRELASHLLINKAKKIIIYSRGELSQVNMERTFDSPLMEYIIGDVRDKDALEMVFAKGIDIVFHLAALKHVPICEYQPKEAINTNVIGVMNILDIAIKYKVQRFIDVSTDKAAEPTNIYGMTKAIAEKLTIHANCISESDFLCIRSGNVLGTSGSVIPLIIKQIEIKNEVTITNSKMTRFFYTLPQAIKLLLFATENGIGGETYVAKMPSFYLRDVIETLVEFYGNSKTKINEIGSREGEKIHEVLVTKHEASRTRFVKDDYSVILPQLKINRIYPDYYESEFSEAGFESSDNLKDKMYLKELLRSGGWL